MRIVFYVILAVIVYAVQMLLLRKSENKIIHMIIDLWSDYGHSNIRQRYNFCKHKGKPIYTEIEPYKGARIMGFYREDGDGNRVQLASDPGDVRLKCSLVDSIEELRTFDNNQLFPYISGLLRELERVLDPSPFV